jgi:hypothetical protein
VIAGAPRCGTTSLFTWLDAHPDVCGARVKEVRFLLDPEDWLFKPGSNFRDHGLSGYESYFDRCAASNARIVVEATPTYLYQRTAPAVLSTLDPLPQIAFLLRKPSDRVYSYFQFLRNNLALIDADLSFRDFVSLAESGESGLPRQSDPRETIARSRYINYLDAWTDRFPRPHVHIFLFEELARDERSFMRHVAETIGVAPGFYESYSYPRENPTYHVRSRWLHQRRRRLARLLSPKTRKLVRRIGVGAYSRINIEPSSGPRPADDAEVLAELERGFAEDNRRLARELNVDLTPWD